MRPHPRTATGRRTAIIVALEHPSRRPPLDQPEVPMTTPEIAITILIVLPMLAIWLYVLVDAIRRDDLSATRKIIWILAALVLPLITIMLYLLTRPRRQAAASPQVPPAEA
jgi:hypothetical protein